METGQNGAMRRAAADAWDTSETSDASDASASSEVCVRASVRLAWACCRLNVLAPGPGCGWQDEAGVPQRRGGILAVLRGRRQRQRELERDREEAWIGVFLGRWSLDVSVQALRFFEVVFAAGCLLVCSNLVGLHWNFVGSHACLPASILTHNPDIVYIRVARRWGTGGKGEGNETKGRSFASASGQLQACSRASSGKF